MAAISEGPVVVIGSGMAGYTFIRQLREYQKDRPICLITADGGEVYSKPLLSNALAQKHTPTSLVQKNGEEKATELNISLMARCEATRIDPVSRIVSTSRGDIAYDKLVLATGAHQRVFLPAGAQPEWIRTVNSLDDYTDWYARLEGARRVLLIGAGLIGCEFADDLLSHGVEVEMVDPAPWPLSRLLPEQMGRALSSALTRAGARLHMGTLVEEIVKSGSGFDVTLNDGMRIECDLVLSATGLVPETALAKSAGLEVGRGVLVNRQMQTSDPHIFALGDCSETEAGPLPYILPLMAQARCLAQVIAGKDSALKLKALPVIVKTTSLPLAICPPKGNAAGRWQVEGEGNDLTGIYYGLDETPLGFAVSGTSVDRKGELGKMMPPLLT